MTRPYYERVGRAVAQANGKESVCPDRLFDRARRCCNHRRAAFLVGVVATVIIHLAFYKLLRVPLPWGVLERWAF